MLVRVFWQYPSAIGKIQASILSWAAMPSGRAAAVVHGDGVGQHRCGAQNLSTGANISERAQSRVLPGAGLGSLSRRRTSWRKIVLAIGSLSWMSITIKPLDCQEFFALVGKGRLE